MLWYYIFLGACIPLAIVPPILIYHEVYKDGIVGRIALVGLSGMAWITWIFHCNSEETDRIPIGLVALIACFMAIFMIWHLFRFHCRVLKEFKADNSLRRRSTDILLQK